MIQPNPSASDSTAGASDRIQEPTTRSDASASANQAPSTKNQAPQPRSASANQAPSTKNQAPESKNQAPDSKNQEQSPPAPRRSHGKIACLPQAIREELNRRLDNGERGPKILAWLNAQLDVRAVLREPRFGGLPVNEQNLSNWRLGGYVRWQRHQADLELTCLLRDEAADFDQAAGGKSPTDLLSAHVALALNRLLVAAEDQSDPAVREQSVLNIARELSLLRRSDQAARHLQLTLEDRAAARRKERDQELAVIADDQFKDAGREKLELIEDNNEAFRGAHGVSVYCAAHNKQMSPIYQKILDSETKYRREAKSWKKIAREKAWIDMVQLCQLDAERCELIAAGLRRGQKVDQEDQDYARLPERERHRWLRRTEKVDAMLYHPPAKDSKKIKVTKAAPAAPAQGDHPAPPSQPQAPEPVRTNQDSSPPHAHLKPAKPLDPTQPPSSAP